MCQQCHQRPAQYHLSSVADGQTVQELHLCESCAAERGLLAQTGPHGAAADPSFSLQGWLASLLAGLGEGASGAGAGGARQEAAGLRCPRCGLTYLEFSRTGLLGCPACYEAFSGQLDPVIRRIHGKSRHEGKVPARTGDGILRRRELAGLKRELEAAVARQDFERAAVLRDRVRALEAAGGGAGPPAVSGRGGQRPEGGGVQS